MKAAIYMGNHSVELKDIPIPDMHSDTVKVKIKYAALCATDIHCVYHGLFNRQPGWGLGHELSGVIEDLGKEAEEYGYHIGDKVVVNPLYSCGKCYYCKKGIPQYCEHKYAHRVTGFAEYAVVSVNQIHKLPENSNLLYASLVEPLSCALRGIDLSHIKPGQNVAISGVGGIGCLLLNLILLRGGANVTAIDIIPSKLENAKAIGAQYTINSTHENVLQRAMEITNGKGFDVIFEASGAPASAEICLNPLAQCGTIMYFAVYPTTYELKLNLFKLYTKEGKIMTAYVTPSNFPRAINLLPQMDMEHIIGKVLPLSEIHTALDLFNQSKYPKIILEC